VDEARLAAFDRCPCPDGENAGNHRFGWAGSIVADAGTAHGLLGRIISDEEANDEAGCGPDSFQNIVRVAS
jgi:hypothetical protein